MAATEPHELQDHQILLEIFPEELWNLIFDKIYYPEDLERLANTTTTFNELLEHRKSTYVFPLVLKFLDTSGYLTSADTQDILNYRLVCKGWKITVDRLLQSRPYHCRLPLFKSHTLGYAPSEDNNSDIAYNTYVNLYRFKIYKLDDEIIPEINSPFYLKRCPFPSQHLLISETQIVGEYVRPFDARKFLLVDYQKASIKFLEKVGHHFEHATIEMHGSSLDWYKLLVKYAELLPNLRSLYIICSSMNMALQKGNREFSHFMTKEYLPFPNLKYLDLLCVYRIPHLALNEILDSNRIKNVAIYREVTDEFQISRVQNPESIYLMMFHLSEFRQLPIFWKPKVLHLDLSHIPIKSFNWVAFFPILERYSGTMEELGLIFPTESSDSFNKEVWDCTLKPLNLSKLKSLIVIVAKHISLNFLLEMKSLKFCSLRMAYIDAQCFPAATNSKENLINHHACIPDKFMECNIWDLVPSVEKIDLGIGPISPIQKFKRKFRF